MGGVNDERSTTDDDAWRYVPPRPRDAARPFPADEAPGQAATGAHAALPDPRDETMPFHPSGAGIPAPTQPSQFQPQPFQPAQFPPSSPRPTAGPPTQGYPAPRPIAVQPAPGNSAPAWAFEEPQPLTYHRMARIDWRVAQWWRPLATLGVAVGLAIAGIIVWGIAALLWEGMGLPAASESLEDGANPADLLVLLGPLATLVPIVVLASWWGGGRRGSIHSVLGRFRWGLMGRAARVIVPVYVLTVLVPPLLFGREEMTVPPLTGSLVAAYVIILVLTPLQCAGEEYLFRGLPQQALGTWLKSPLWGIVLPVPLFVLGHGYDWVGQIDIACFALCAGALVWRSGGLELSILVHASNNMMAFLLGPFSSNSLAQGAVDPAALLFSLPLTFGVTAWLWWWVGKQYGLGWKTPVRRLPGPQREKVGRWL